MQGSCCGLYLPTGNNRYLEVRRTTVKLRDIRVFEVSEVEILRIH